MRIWQTGLLGLALILGVARAQGPVPVGEQFQVNTYTWGEQWHPRGAFDSAGNFVVVWHSYGSFGTDTSYSSIQAQHFDAAGNPTGAQFQVNTYTTSKQGWPSVAIDADGDFVVAWMSEGSFGTDSDSWSIQGQRYDAVGNPLGDEFQVNTYTTSFQQISSVAIDADGDFVVVWEGYGSYGTDSDRASIQGQRFDAAGNRLGGEFQVNTYTTGGQYVPSLAVDADGDFVVVWFGGSYGTDSDWWSIQGQRFDTAGNPTGGQFQVNTYTTGGQHYPTVAARPSGDFVVVWHSRGSFGTDSDSSSIQGQRYDAVGNPLGGEFQVNSYTTDYQEYPSVAVDSSGDFVVVWNSDGSFGTDSDSWSIQGQRFDASSNRLGGEFQVNTYTTSSQWFPSVAVDSSGDFLTVWPSDGSFGTDSDSWSIQGQRFLAIPVPCYSLTLSHTGQGADPVASPTHSDGCIAGEYHQGEAISLTAFPDSGWEVGSWYGTDEDSSIATTNSLTMPASSHTAGVNYLAIPVPCYSLTLSHTGQGADPIASPTHSDGCTAGEYHQGEAISLTVFPDAGWEVGSWYGTDDDTSTATTNSLTMPASNHAAGVNYVPQASLIFADGFESGDTSAWSYTEPPEGHPVADFTFFANGLTVQFVNESQGDFPMSYLWDFDDGSPTTTQENPQHTFPVAGTYDVSLTVSNAIGDDTVIKEVTVNP